MISSSCSTSGARRVNLVPFTHFFLQNGALSAVPYVCTAVMSIIAGHFADCLRSRRILTTTHTRKVFQCIGKYIV